MPKLKENQVPSYRLYRQSGQAIVTLSGRDHLLGAHGSPESRAKYDRLIAEWLANGRRAEYRGAAGLTVSRVIAEFWAHAKAYYGSPNGSQTGELENFRVALIPLRRLYGATLAAKFGPKALTALQREMIRMGWCRNHINRQTARVRQMFKWAVAQELAPPAVYHGLVAVAGLREGKCDARESKPVRPVPDAWVELTLPHLARQVQAMIRLQLLTGMRPGEVVIMRGCDLDTGGNVWVYRPLRHKTEHHGVVREVRLGPKAQEIIRPFLKPDLQAYLFSPAEAESERQAARRAARKTKVWRSHEQRQRRLRAGHPRAAIRDRYDTYSYRQAIGRACDIAFPPPADLARRKVRGNRGSGERLRWETRGASGRIVWGMRSGSRC